MSQVPTPANVSENTNGTSDELLRLRAEVTRLREMRPVRPPRKSKNARNMESEIAQIMSNNHARYEHYFPPR